MISSPPLILHVIHHLVTGGMENGVVNLINKLPASKFRHAVVCIEDFNDFRDRIIDPDVEVIALNRSAIGVWRMRLELLRIFRRLQPAIVHSRNQSGLDALLPARLAGVPYCIHGEHGWDVDNLDGRKWKPTLLKKLHAPLVSRYVTVSCHLRDFLIERIGINPTRIEQIYNGVDTQIFHPDSTKDRDALPPSLLGNDKVLIGTVGRIQAVKDQATLLRAFALLLERHEALRTHVRLVVVGGGPLLEFLKGLAQTLQISDLTWFAGPMPTVADALRRLDLFVLPSLNEGISNTILEAMASGLPVMATAVGGNVELVDDQITGRWFTPGDQSELADLLYYYCVSNEMRQQHGLAARQVALERFSLNTMLAHYEVVYENGLRNRG